MTSNGITKEVSKQTHVLKTTTYRIGLEGGIDLLLTLSPNDYAEIKAEWANGETMEYFHELTLTAKDIHKVASLFSFVNVEVNA